MLGDRIMERAHLLNGRVDLVKDHRVRVLGCKCPDFMVKLLWCCTMSPTCVPSVQKNLPFFCLNAAWLNEGRCPGGPPSVSENFFFIWMLHGSRMACITTMFTEVQRSQPWLPPRPRLAAVARE